MGADAKVWDQFYEIGCDLEAVYVFTDAAGAGISTDRARRKKVKCSARFIAAQARKILVAKPVPELRSPVSEAQTKRVPGLTAISMKSPGMRTA